MSKPINTAGIVVSVVVLSGLACLCLRPRSPTPGEEPGVPAAPGKPLAPRPRDRRGTWASFHRANPQRTGVFRTKGVESFHRITKWDGLRVDGKPAIGDGALFVMTGHLGLTAFELGSRTPRWEFKATIPISDVSITYVDGTVLCSSRTSSEIRALDARTGAERWTFRPEEHYTGGEPGHVPVVGGGTVVFGSRHLYAVGLVDGMEQWRVEATHPDPRTSFGMPSLDGDAVYVRGPDGVLSVDRRSGVQRWSLPARTVGASVGDIGPPVVDGDVVYLVLSGGAVVTVDATRGTVRSTTIVSPIPPTHSERDFAWLEALLQQEPVVDHGIVYVASGGSLIAFDAQAEQVRWKYRPEGSGTYRPPVMAGDLLFTSSVQDGQLHAIDKTRGVERWRVGVPDEVSHMELADGRIYFTSKSSLYVVE